MTPDHPARERGFTLIELLAALLILSLVALMSYRGLGAVLDAREHVTRERDKWRNVATFFARFERDIQLAAPRAVRDGAGSAAAWRGQRDPTLGSRLEFSRFASAEGGDTARRVTYGLNEKQEIELWLWPGLDMGPSAQPARYAVLAGVASFELRYLNPDLVWFYLWPVSTLHFSRIPQAVQIRIVLVSGEEIVRTFALKS